MSCPFHYEKIPGAVIFLNLLRKYLYLGSFVSVIMISCSHFVQIKDVYRWIPLSFCSSQITQASPLGSLADEFNSLTSTLLYFPFFNNCIQYFKNFII